MRSIVEIGASVPAFLGKLWKLVNDTETNHLISWSPGGKTFVIKNQANFARELLPLYYKHNNMASFIRQLNMYGFHKITSVENGGLRYEKDEIEFSHPCFMRGHAYLLEHIKRKIANPKSIVTSSDSGEKILIKPELMNKVLSDVKQMKGKQENLDAKFSAMKQENEALWREVAILRQKHIKQQQIVNNLIQFLMSLVQPARPPSTNVSTAGVKRRYQLMINNAAHNSATDGAYPNNVKNVKHDTESLLEELNDDNLEDGPTIHELAHDDILHNEASQDSMDPINFVTIEVPAGSGSNRSPNDPAAALQYKVTLEDEEADTDEARAERFYPICSTDGTLHPNMIVPQETSPTVPDSTTEQIISNVMASPGTSESKSRSNAYKSSVNPKSLLSPSNFNNLNPSADLRLPAEIFASDDSISDAGLASTEDFSVQNVLQDPILTGELISEPVSKDRMLGGINIEMEKPQEQLKTASKKCKKTGKDNNLSINLADIKTELQDDMDWANMSLATVNNNSNINRFDSRNRRDNIAKSREEFASHFGTNQNKNDIDDHLDSMQTDLNQLRELLRSDSYSLDTNTLLGLFGSDDPFYNISYNAVDERPKSATNGAMKLKAEIENICGDDECGEILYADEDVDANQLISYTGNIPDFEYITMPKLEGESSQEASPAPSVQSLHTPLVEYSADQCERTRSERADT